MLVRSSTDKCSKQPTEEGEREKKRDRKKGIKERKSVVITDILTVVMNQSPDLSLCCSQIGIPFLFLVYTIFCLIIFTIGVDSSSSKTYI